MNAKTFALVLVLAFSSATTPVIGKDKPKDKAKPGKKSTSAALATVAKSKDAAPAQAGGQKEPWLNVDVTIGAPERDVIREYVRSCETHNKGKKPKGLPPGLAKKVARGGDLPTGWQKKCVRGEILPEEVFKGCHRLPHELVVKLPPPPAGTILVAIDGKMVRLAKATREILDVFDVR